MKIKPKYFDDFHIGETFETEPNLISKDEIIDFASKYDPQAFHLDEEAAKNGPFGQLTSSGFMTLGKSFTQIFNTDVFNGSSMGAWGLDELRWTKPVYPGDTLKTKVEVLEKKLSSKPNQRDRKVKTNCFKSKR
jgi:acyl dehydratase